MDYTITLTAEQDTALAAVTQRENAERAAKIPPLAALTATQYLQRRILEVASSYVEHVAKDERAKVEVAYAAAAKTKKDQVKTVLGVS